MRSAKRTILIMLLIGAGSLPLGSRASARQLAAEKRTSAWDLIRKSRSKQAESAETPTKERVVYFPKDRSVGQLRIEDAGSVNRCRPEILREYDFAKVSVHNKVADH